jgi:hypothetical protein
MSVGDGRDVLDFAQAGRPQPPLDALIPPTHTRPRRRRPATPLHHERPPSPPPDDCDADLVQLKSFFVFLFQWIISVYHSYEGTLSVTRREIERILVYAIVVIASGLNGLKIPCPVDGNFQNFTKPTGFSPDFSNFSVSIGSLTPFSRCLFLYGQFFRKDLTDDSLQVYSNQTVAFGIVAEGIRSSGSIERSESFVSPVNLTIPFSRRSPVVLFFHRTKNFCHNYTFNITVDGNLGAFDTFQIAQFALNSQFSKTMLWYRLVFLFFAVGITNLTKKRMIVCFVIFVFIGPTTIWQYVAPSKNGFVLDMVLGDLFVLFLYNIWFFGHSRACEKVSRMAIGYLNFVVFVCMVYDSVTRASAQFCDPHRWLFGPVTSLHSAMIGVFGLMLGLTYGAFVFRRKDPNGHAIDIGTYAFFVAQICRILDEVAVRMRVLRCMGMWRHLRMFTEIGCAYFLAGERDDSKSGETIVEGFHDAEEEGEIE